MKEIWTSIANALSGKNGPLYIALLAITSLTLGWKFLDENYTVEWKGGKISPTDTTQSWPDKEPESDSGITSEPYENLEE